MHALEVKAGRSSGGKRRAPRGEFVVSPQPGGAPVQATRAKGPGKVMTANGKPLRHRKGDFITSYADGGKAVVRGDIFRRTYRKVGKGSYAKRTDVSVRASIAKRDQIVRTLEGPQPAKRGDIIMRGTAGERWPVAAGKFHSRYRVHF